MNDRCDKNERCRRNNGGVKPGDSSVVCCTVPDNDSGENQAEAFAADAMSEAPETRRRRRSEFSDPICISGNQIYDSCRDRDCVSEARVYLTQTDQALIQNAINVKLKRAEIIWVYTNIEPLSFNNGYFSVDLKFFVRATLEVFTGVCNPTTVYGLTTYDKRVILFGSEGNSKVFKSDFNLNSGCDISTTWQNTAMPTVVVETVEPVALGASIKEPRCCDCSCECETTGNRDFFPDNICCCFDEDLVISDNVRHITVSYGLFSIIRLERDTQLLIDAVDFCIPKRECPAATESKPCTLFNDIRFPIDEFFPPSKASDSGNGGSCGCGCGGNFN